MSIKEYFPGANTPDGFYSYYSDVLKPDETERKIILKGGPGTGKSSLMKKVAEKTVSLGMDTELLHCSSDPDSLDGVCIRECGFLIVDGTSPHIIAPSVPGASDEIINLGDFLDKEKIIPNKKEICMLSADISEEFKNAYRYMKAAKCIGEQAKKEFKTDTNCVMKELERIKKELSLNTLCPGGRERRAFLKAHTHLGSISYSHTWIHNHSQTE